MKPSPPKSASSAAAPPSAASLSLGSSIAVKPITRVLVANRGEIACRIIRTCKELGIHTIAVFSEADRYARHVRLADEALCIGEAESVRSYLSAEAVLEAAKRSRADAIHPGYGFLSENSAFAELVTKAGMRFIGPTPGAMRLVGDKLSAKKIAMQAKVPMAPSVEIAAEEKESRGALAHFIKQEGFPIIVKAAGGGGGRGMRKVYEQSALEDALASASREATNFFKDGRVFCEKLIEHARHIEVQILGDTCGNVMHFYDRDCTMQRNHQKVLEEAPAPGLPGTLRSEIHAAAVRLMKEAGYSNAGTVEFLLAPDGRFFFLEVNSRLQVEHPVTEALFGVDLVALQIGVAEGRALAELLPEGLPPPRGAALEARLCSEIPEEQFVASTGKLLAFSLASPTLAEQSPEATLRVDTGFETGDTVTHFYDSLLAKLIVHAPTREQALIAMIHVLSQCRIEGVKVNRGFLAHLVGHHSFHQVTHEINLAATLVPIAAAIEEAQLQAVLAVLAQQIAPPLAELPSQSPSLALSHEIRPDPWNRLRGFRLHGAGSVSEEFLVSGARIAVKAEVDAEGSLRLDEVSTARTGGASSAQVSPSHAKGAQLLFKRRGSNLVEFTISGKQVAAQVSNRGNDCWVHLAQGSFLVTRAKSSLRTSEASMKAHAGEVVSHLPGKVIEVKSKIGDSVEADSLVVVIESMKMEHRIQAGVKGQVKTVSVEPGQVIQSGQILLIVAPA
jgi:3-methylcrotonyl-CoA carboxylase alpha subunit